MTDRFKFRIWDKPLKKYMTLNEFRLMNIEFTFNRETKESEIEFDKERYIVEQCTGLKDKNGKLIYEGDWLKTKDGYYCYVVWYDGFWWVKSLPSEAMDLEHSEFYKECEVIGNIHENKELLND